MMSFDQSAMNNVSTHTCVPSAHAISSYPAAMSVTGEAVECDASASKYSYIADVSKEYKRGLLKACCVFQC